MIQTVRVRTITDNGKHEEALLHEAQKYLPRITAVKRTKLYRLEGITKQQAQKLAEKLLSEAINQTYSINRPLFAETIHTLEIGYKSGVMNPEVASLLKAAADLGIPLTAADTSWEYGFASTTKHLDVEKLATTLRLFNPTVEQLITTIPKTLLIQGIPGKTTTIPMRSMTDEDLLALSQDTLFLNLAEMKVIQHYFQQVKRDPTDCELETLAQTWSEHCAHKTFKANLIVDGEKQQPLFSRLRKEALKHDKHIVSAFVDNSGVMDFYEGMAICGKVETHNSPSAIEPYGGAMTGSGGVFRDVVGTGQGAKTILSTDIFCLAEPAIDRALLPEGTLPPDYLLKKVVAGVRDYGNRMGIPTSNGSVHFHTDFRAKPTIIVGAYGILPVKRAQKGNPHVGDRVIAVGGRTGRDGIHGATFSSAEMTDRTRNVNASAVQIGNAIEEKRMFDALLEARDAGLIRAAQDCGAGGFSSAIGELGEKTGVRVQLKDAPIKYQGLSPWEIWVSESQERMILAVAPAKTQQFLKICKKYNVEATVLGVFDGSHKLRVYYGRELVCDLSMQFLHHGLPQRTMIATKPKYAKQQEKKPTLPTTEKQWVSLYKRVLSHPNICSKEPIVRLYDHSVQGTNALQPFGGEKLDGPNDATVLRPLLNKSYGMVVSHGMHPVLNRLDPYWGSIWAATEALANYTAVGGNYKEASLINNYIWPFPDEESLWSLNQSVSAVTDFMSTLRIPVISGKDSLSSTYRGKDGTVIMIPPVLCISAFGKIPDVARTTSSDFKQTNSLICLVGQMDWKSMGGSAYFDCVKQKNGTVPHTNLSLLPRVLQTLYSAIRTGNVLSCHDISEGGIATALFEMCVGGNCGAVIDLKQLGQIQPDYALFNETAGCFLIETADEKTAEKLFRDVPYTLLGKTQTKQAITVNRGRDALFTAELSPLKQAWKKPMEELFS